MIYRIHHGSQPVIEAQNEAAVQRSWGRRHVTQGIDYFLIDRNYPLIDSPEFPEFLFGRQRCVYLQDKSL